MGGQVHVFGVGLLQQTLNGVPVAQVVPAKGDGHDIGAISVLHHGVVDAELVEAEVGIYAGGDQRLH